jgi:Ser/Thr protein kinase RdoA (MazF antagonist)
MPQTAHDARALLDRCGLGEVARVRLLTRERNVVYQVCATDGRRYILRFRRGDRLSLPSARMQQRWLAAIARDTEVVAPTVVPLDGKPFQLDGDAQVALFTWVQGRRARGANGFVAPANLRAVGVAAARLHRHAERFRVGDTAGLRRFDVDFFFPGDHPRLAARDRQLLTRLKQRARRAMKELGDSPRRFGLLHGDLGAANWIFHRGDARPIDFEEFGLGPFVFDLAQVLWTHSMWPRYDDYRGVLFAAYESVRPLDATERRHVALFEGLALLDWVNRCVRNDDRPSLKRWLRPTMRRIRALAVDRP